MVAIIYRCTGRYTHDVECCTRETKGFRTVEAWSATQHLVCTRTAYHHYNSIVLRQKGELLFSGQQALAIRPFLAIYNLSRQRKVIQTTRRRTRLARTLAVQGGDIEDSKMALTEPLMRLMARVTNPVWTWHQWRFGLVLKSTPTKHPVQLPQDNMHNTTAGLEGLSTCGVYTLCLDSSPGHPFLGRGFRYLSLCCTVV